MAKTGTATLDFGAFPGSAMASLAVVDAGIGATDLVEAWINIGTATAEHSADEHEIEPLKVTAKNDGAGVGLTIKGECINPQPKGSGGARLYGNFKVNWAYAPLG